MDDELQAIRAKRMAEMQAQSAAQRRDPAAEKREMDERKGLIMAQILLPEARERLARVRLVKPERADQVEAYLIQAAQANKLTGRVDENTLINLLNDVSQSSKKTSIKFARRHEEEDDDY
eukprot:TRINITY_DN2085_c0_g1_i1.p1 TRINITY_DN2085_c0_g1~~TRINITY_DN2085_c0_g1_i1.p1  ORF type:complete len:132 (-),score=55.97 TRINITY_DN2085_c0_g1_i1:59-418(-)